MRYFSRDFTCDFYGITGSYRLRRISSIRSSCDFERTFNGLILINRTEAARRSHGHRTISVQPSRSFSKLSTDIVRSPYEARTASVQRLYDFFGQHFHQKSEVCYTIIARRPYDASTICLRPTGLQFLKVCITFYFTKS